MITNQKKSSYYRKKTTTQNTKKITDAFLSEKKCFNGLAFQIKIFIFFN